MELLQAQEIVGRDFLGPNELHALRTRLGIMLPKPTDIPAIPFSREELVRARRAEHLLILGIPVASDGEPLTLMKMRERFGIDPSRSEPCFYNQDWYLNEPFACETAPELQWYLIRKAVTEESRGKNPDDLVGRLSLGEKFPPAVLTAFAFFAYYFHSGGGKLWEHDFVWCSDNDSNGDRIYTGRYCDPRKLAKNGFNIHRHLTIRSCHGSAPVR